MTSNENYFKQYLLREFFWELSQHDPLPEGFIGVQPEIVQVLEFRGYDDLRVRVADAVYDIRLTWRKDLAPSIKRSEKRSERGG